MLWLLLAPDDALSFGELSDLLANEGGTIEWGSSLPGLLERMLEALATDPDRLDTVASLLNDLRTTEAGRELLGTDFDDVWLAGFVHELDVMVVLGPVVAHIQDHLPVLLCFEPLDADPVGESQRRPNRLLKKSSGTVSALNRRIVAHAKPFVFKGFL